jgi:hypothetical protein
MNEPVILSTFKGQIKPYADWRSVDSPKKQTNDFFLLFMAKKNKFVRSFFGRIYGAKICLRFYLTFRRFPSGH